MKILNKKINFTSLNKYIITGYKHKSYCFINWRPRPISYIKLKEPITEADFISLLKQKKYVINYIKFYILNEDLLQSHAGDLLLVYIATCYDGRPLTKEDDNKPWKFGATKDERLSCIIILGKNKWEIIKKARENNLLPPD